MRLKLVIGWVGIQKLKNPLHGFVVIGIGAHEGGRISQRVVGQFMGMSYDTYE